MDNLFSSFYNKFNEVINKHEPMKTTSNRKAKKLSKPWITKDIRISIKVKNKLYPSGDTANYKTYRNKISTLGTLVKKNRGGGGAFQKVVARKHMTHPFHLAQN